MLDTNEGKETLVHLEDREKQHSRYYVECLLGPK
jgi:hypothetical protein